MSYSDKTFGEIFPTRTGSTGTANERQMLDELGGSESFRTRLRTNPDGSVTLLRTKDGMPQFYTLEVRNQGCPLETGPIVENLYANRLFHSNEGAWFSHDRLYSVEKQATKAIDVLLPNGVFSNTSHLCMGKPLVINGVPQATGGVAAQAIAPDDFVETSRTHYSGNIRTFVRNTYSALLFYSKAAISAITFSRQTCDTRNLSLNFVGAQPPVDNLGYLSGDYRVGSMDTTQGLVKEINYAELATSYKLKMQFGGSDNGKGGFLEMIHPTDWEKVYQHQTYAEDGVTKLHWPVPYKFGPPTRGFTCSQGTFEDETRAVPNSIAQENGIFEATSAGEQGTPGRYFNFYETDVLDEQVIGTTTKLKHDAIFNISDTTPPVPHFHSAPGMSATELRADEHLYRDPTGAVWVIRITCVPGGTDLLRFWLMRRFDRIYRTDPTFGVLIGSFTSTNSGNDPVDDPSGFYLTGAMQVLSLPDGTSCGITLYSPVTTTGLVTATFSGTVDPATGNGLSVSCVQHPTWLLSASHTDAAPVVEYDTNTAYEDFTAFDASGISFVETDLLRNDYGRTLWSQWAVTQPSGTVGGPFMATRSATHDYRSSQKTTYRKKRNIELRPRKSNTWEFVVSEWMLETDAYVEESSTASRTTSTTALLINQSTSIWSLSGGGKRTHKVGVKRTSSSTVSFGGNLITASITADYGTAEETVILAAPNPGYSPGPGYGFISNTCFADQPTSTDDYDTVSGNFISQVTIVPDPNNHTYGTTFIKSPSSCYTADVWLLLGGVNKIVLGFSSSSLFGGYPFDTMLPSNKMELVCHDPRNERVWVAGSKNDAGYFY